MHKADIVARKLFEDAGYSIVSTVAGMHHICVQKKKWENRVYISISLSKHVSGIAQIKVLNYTRSPDHEEIFNTWDGKIYYFEGEKDGTITNDFDNYKVGDLRPKIEETLVESIVKSSEVVYNGVLEFD
jgi:hypothetical protein